MSSFYRGFQPSILCMIPYAGVECAVHQVRRSIYSRIQIHVHVKDAVFNYFASYCSRSWTGQRAIRPTTVTPNCFSSVLWPLLLDKRPVTHWPWSGLSSKHKVNLRTLCDTLEIIWNYLRRFTHLRRLSRFPAFSSDSRPTSGVLQGLIGIYERQGLRGYYNGMGASFVRAIPCALINYTLTRKFENLFSSTESWDVAERLLSLCAELFSGIWSGTQRKPKLWILINANSVSKNNQNPLKKWLELQRAKFPRHLLSCDSTFNTAFLKLELSEQFTAD